MKKATIIIRCTTEMKTDVEGLAQDCRRTVSDYLRLIFEDLIQNKKNGDI